MWAAAQLFGFLRVSEFTTPSDTRYDKDCHLSIDDISIDSRDNPQLLKVALKQSKLTPFMWVLTSTIWSVKALLPYLAVHGHYKGSSLHPGRRNISHTPMPLYLAEWLTDWTTYRHLEIYYTQFPHWPSHHSKTNQYSGCPHPIDGKIEEQCLPDLH